MGRMKDIAIQLQEAGVDVNELEDPHNEFGLLDFDNHDASEHPEWAIDAELTCEELAQLDSDADLFDARLNGYQ